MSGVLRNNLGEGGKAKWKWGIQSPFDLTSVWMVPLNLFTGKFPNYCSVSAKAWFLGLGPSKTGWGAFVVVLIAPVCTLWTCFTAIPHYLWVGSFLSTGAISCRLEYLKHVAQFLGHSIIVLDKINIFCMYYLMLKLFNIQNNFPNHNRMSPVKKKNKPLLSCRIPLFWHDHLPALDILTGPWWQIQCGPEQQAWYDQVRDAFAAQDVQDFFPCTDVWINRSHYRKDSSKTCQVCQITKLTARAHYNLDGNQVVCCGFLKSQNCWEQLERASELPLWQRLFTAHPNGFSPFSLILELRIKSDKWLPS